MTQKEDKALLVDNPVINSPFKEPSHYLGIQRRTTDIKIILEMKGFEIEQDR